MELLQMIDFKSQFEKHLDQKLLEFDVFFAQYMWNGWDDDNGQFMSNEDYEAMEALSDKIKHMVLYIGCPSSVRGMLVSISERKIKYWQAQGDKKGKQLRSKADRVRASNDWNYERDKGKMVIKGHFRWNNRGYMISRKCADALNDYLLTQGF